MFLFANVFVYIMQPNMVIIFDHNAIYFIISSLSNHSKMQFCICLGYLGFYPEFYFYPGFTQLPRVKLGVTVQRFYPPILGEAGKADIRER